MTPMRVLLLCLSIPVLALSACSSVSLDQPAPVIRHNSAAPSAAAVIAPSGPFAAHAGQPGYYTVQHGDTLGSVAHRFGHKVHQLLAWNTLANPNVIEVGLVLRVSPPPEPAHPVAVARPLGAAAASRPAPATHPASASHAAAARRPASAPHPASQVAPSPRHGASAAAASAAPAVAGSWIRPARGSVLQAYNGGSSQGIDYAGKLGDPVVAAAPGKVVYAGSELRGYGNLVIIKHDHDYLSVYAHNDKLLVKDGADVSQGQQIATMGSSDASRVELHFEIRQRGKPIDPQPLLPH